MQQVAKLYNYAKLGGTPHNRPSSVFGSSDELCHFKVSTFNIVYRT